MRSGRLVAIVQARFGSTRLPGKVLEPLGEGTVLSEVLGRCRLIASVDEVCCAVADTDADVPVAAAAERAGVRVVRGPSADVLARYALAARQTSADEILRVTSDCPLIDPAVCEQVIRTLRESGADYVANNNPPSFPHGLDCEAMTRKALDLAAERAESIHDREHVTPWLRRADSVGRAWVSGPGGAAAAQRWTLDYAEDLAFVRAVFDLLPPDPRRYDWRMVWDVVRANPKLSAINLARRDPDRIAAIVQARSESSP
jgi:spore coat polysaccharide biosynthesis protein SpsF